MDDKNAKIDKVIITFSWQHVIEYSLIGYFLENGYHTWYLVLYTTSMFQNVTWFIQTLHLVPIYHLTILKH